MVVRLFLCLLLVSAVWADTTTKIPMSELRSKGVDNTSADDGELLRELVARVMVA